MWRGGQIAAIIDAKYKRLVDKRFPNADAYQMLAYCTAFGLEQGFLVYARDTDQQPRLHHVRDDRSVITTHRPSTMPTATWLRSMESSTQL